MPSTRELRTAIRVLETFKEVDPDITLPSMLALLYYAERDNESGNQSQMHFRLNMSEATSSRATAHWMDYKRPRVEGQNFIESNTDPEDRRYRIITLKRSGLEFIKKLEEAVAHGTS